MMPQVGPPMNPYLLMGLGMLGNTDKPGPAGIGQGALQGMMMHQQMQKAEMDNQAMSQALQTADEQRQYLASLSPAERRQFAGMTPDQIADVRGRLMVADATAQGRLAAELAKKTPGWQGSGFRAQAANMYNQLSAKLAAGEELTPTERNNLSMAFQTLTQERTIATPEGTHRVPGMNLTVPEGMVGEPGFVRPSQPSFTPKPATEGERKALSLYTRASKANEVLRGIEAGGEYDPSAVTAGNVRDYIGLTLKEASGPVTRMMGAMMTSPEATNYATSAGEFIASLLRYDSGAAVPDTEFTRYYNIYFPLPGEGKEALQVRAARRDAVVRALEVSAGRALSQEEFRQEMRKKTEQIEQAMPLPMTPGSPDEEEVSVNY